MAQTDFEKKKQLEKDIEKNTTRKNDPLVLSSQAITPYELENVYIPISGTEVRVVLEFPQEGTGKSVIFELDDAMSISYSIYRAKPSVITLGSSSIGGYGLGVRTVAGSIIRSVFTTDKFTDFQVNCYLEEQKNIGKRLAYLDGETPKGLTKDARIAIMKDDLSSFNIHCVSVSEQTRLNKRGEVAPRTRFESIFGCIIINNGQVYSIHDLMTENTLSFQARAVRTSSNIEDYNRGFSDGEKIKAASSLL